MNESMKRRGDGFGLIEVLIALVVMSIGLLGIAKMEGLALASTGVASMRSLAAIEASSLASAMHANTAYWAAGLAPASFTVSATATGPSISDPTLAAAADCTSASGGAQPYCTPARTAGYDVQQWGAALQALLPNYQATVNCSTVVGTPVTCTIQIAWAEKTVAINAQSVNGPAMQAPTYTLYVQP
jgi:type IV pilus assembly protein PilV